MAVQVVSVEQFIELSNQYPILDVRSPAEYTHAHIHKAISFPLFTDDERKQVGTIYKQRSRQQAIQIGLDFFGPKMKTMVLQAEALAKQHNTQIFLVHCWRGGMRSAAIAWLLNLYGFTVHTLKGGYKAYRNWALQQFTQPYPLQIIGGYTGSGKTAILQNLQNMGEVVLDLEAIAGHRGSAFGHLGLPPQESAEMIENKLALALFNATQQLAQNHKNIIWTESESQRIGNVNLPQALYYQLKKAPYLFIAIPFAERLKYIVQGYGSFEQKELMNAVLRIQKKLGGLATKQALGFLLDGDVEQCFALLLQYYDKFYERSSQQDRKDIVSLPLANTNAKQNAAAILAFLQKN